MGNTLVAADRIKLGVDEVAGPFLSGGAFKGASNRKLEGLSPVDFDPLGI